MTDLMFKMVLYIFGTSITIS